MTGYGICLNEWLEDSSIKNELRLLIKISSLTANNGYCFASNEYLAKYFNMDETTASRQIKKLIDKGYLKAEYTKRGAEVTERKLRLAKMLTDGTQKCQPTISKNAKYNSTSINNINTNISLKAKKETFKDDYDVQTFIQDWSDARMYYLKKPTHFKKLAFQTERDFQEVKKLYTRKEIRKAMEGLFIQKNTLGSMTLKPNHFLSIDNFESYYTAAKSKEQLFGGDKKQKPKDTI